MRHTPPPPIPKRMNKSAVSNTCMVGTETDPDQDIPPRMYSDVPFNSPKHNVLRVSYCDSAVSVVRRPSCVVSRVS